MSLGELFIQLGVVGDTREIEETQKRLKKATKQAEDFVNTIREEIEYNDKLEEVLLKAAKATQDLYNAKNEEEKASAQAALQAANAQKQRLIELQTAKKAAQAARAELDANQEEIDKKKEMAKKIAGVVKGVTGFVTALVGAGIALNKFTNDLVASNQTMLDLTRTTDIALETFQKWDGIGKMLGVENAAQQLEGLNQRIFELMLTGQGAKGFQIAGINPVGQDAEGVLEQLRDRVSGMSDTAATYLLREMGLDPKMLHLLRMTREEFESLQAEIKKYRLTDDQTKQIQKMNIQLQIAGIKLKYLKDRAVLALMPYWVKFVESLARVSEGLSIFCDWLTKTDDLGAKTARSFLAVAAAIGVVKVALWALTSHPIVATITAILGALYLLIDDIMAYYQGGRSGIGYLIGYFDELEKDLENKNWGGAFTKLLDPITALSKITFPWATQLLDVSASMDKFNKAVEYGLELGRKMRNGQATGGAAPINYTGEVELPDWVQNMLIDAVNPDGYVGNLPDLSSHFVTPAMERNLSYNTNTTTTTDNRKISMTNYIQTNQTGTDILNQLAYARNAMAAGWA